MRGRADRSTLGDGPLPARTLGPVPALDGLRGVAVLLVLVHHLQVLIPSRQVVDGGFLGVDVFFVLSGFLITALLVGERRARGRIDLAHFYWRRALRLLPALYLLLAVHTAYAFATGLSMESQWRSVRAALLYVSNWSWRWDGLDAADGLGHLWSLAVEEQFYLVWPAVVAAVALGRRGRTVPPVLLAAAVVLVAVHRVRLLDDGESILFLYQRTDARLDALLVGALVAVLWVRGRTPQRWLPTAGWAATAFLAVAVVVARWDQPAIYRWWLTGVAVAVAVVLLAAVDGRWSGARILELRALRAVGRVSYGLYLWNLPVIVAVGRYGDSWRGPVRVAVALVLVAVCTLGSWFVVERPILEHKHRAPWRRTRPRPTSITVPVPALVPVPVPVAEPATAAVAPAETEQAPAG